MSNFSKNLTYLRKQKKQTQQMVADGIGVKRATYAAWEEDRGKPDFDNIEKLCKYYNVYDIYNLITQEIKS